jgi:hypothetical protein
MHGPKVGRGYGQSFNQNENDITLHIHITVYKFSFWFKDGAKENYVHKGTNFCRFLLKMSNFAIPLPSSYVITLELFHTQNLIWTPIV